MDKTKDDGSPKAKEKAMAGVLSQPARWRLLQLLAKDDGMPVRELARRIGRKPRLTARDISLMRKAGLVVWFCGDGWLGNRRKIFAPLWVGWGDV